MANIYGSIAADDTITSILVANGGSILQFPIEDLTLFVDSLYAAHNKLLSEHLGMFVSFTGKRLWNYRGNTNSGGFEKIAEGGLPAMQRNSYSEQIQGIPMEAYGKALGWTREAFLMMSPEQWRAEHIATLNHDTKNVINRVQDAIFIPTNLTFVDYRTDWFSLPVKAFANGDSFLYPSGAQGSTFSNHSHYLGRIGGSWAAADMDAAQNTLLEHYPNATIRHLISRSNISTMTGVTGYTKYEVERVHVSTTDRYSTTKLTSYQDNYKDMRDIGEYNGAVVSALWWVPQNYMITIIESDDVNHKPLLFRYRGGDETMGSTLPTIYLPNGGGEEPGMGSLRVVKTTDSILNAVRVEREFGVAANERLSLCVSKMDNATYSAPSSYGV